MVNSFHLLAVTVLLPLSTSAAPMFGFGRSNSVHPTQNNPTLPPRPNQPIEIEMSHISNSRLPSTKPRVPLTRISSAGGLSQQSSTNQLTIHQSPNHSSSSSSRSSRSSSSGRGQRPPTDKNTENLEPEELLFEPTLIRSDIKNKQNQDDIFDAISKDILRSEHSNRMSNVLRSSSRISNHSPTKFEQREGKIFLVDNIQRAQPNNANNQSHKKTSSLSDEQLDQRTRNSISFRESLKEGHERIKVNEEFIPKVIGIQKNLPGKGDMTPNELKKKVRISMIGRPTAERTSEVENKSQVW